MDLRSLNERAAFWLSGLNLGAAALVLVAERWEKTSKLLDALRAGLKSAGLPEWVAVPLIVAIFGLGFLYFLLQAVTLRSRLRQPSRFLIDKELAHHLKGREEETKELGELCERAGLVFLEGESGSGKSALVAGGLVPWCAGSPIRPLPIRCDLSGATGNSSLATMLARSVFRDTYDQRSNLGWTTALDADSIFNALASIERKIQRKPLLVFDQFDDYEDAHRSEFYRRGDREMVTAEEFLQGHPFWAALAAGVQADGWHCAFVTRSDQRAGLDLVRFIEPVSYRIGRLPRNSVAPILDELTRPGTDGSLVIESPDKGWRLLSEKLLDDLSSEDKSDVLPVQLAIAVQGLQQLDALTIREYMRHGGLSGLARLHIQREVQRVARDTQTDHLKILALLGALIDADRVRSRRLTVGALSVPLLQEHADHGSGQQGLQKTLDVLLALKRRHLVRSVIDFDPSGQDVWLLYHDSLALGILAYQRETDRWQTVLAKHEKRFRHAAGLRARWQALMPIRLQMRLMWERLRVAIDPTSDKTAFRFSGYRRYAVLSALKPMSSMMIAAIGGLIWWSVDGIYRDERAANDLLVSLGDNPSRLAPNELAALIALEKRGPGAARKALKTVLRIPTQAEQPKAQFLAFQFDRVLGRVVHAAWGIRATSTESTELLARISSPACMSNCMELQVSLFSRILPAIPLPNHQDLTAWGEALTERIAIEKSPVAVAAPANALAALVVNGVKAEDAHRWGKVVVNRMSNGNSRGPDINALSRALRGLVRTGVRNDDVHEWGQALVDRIAHETDNFVLEQLGVALTELVARDVNETDARRWGQVIARHIIDDKLSSWSVPGATSALLGLVGRGMSEADARRAAHEVVRLMTDGRTLAPTEVWLAKALVAMVGKSLNEEDARQWGRELTVRLSEPETDTGTVAALGEALSALIGKGADEVDVGQAGQELVRRISDENSNDQNAELAAALRKLAGKGISRRIVEGWGSALGQRMSDENATPPLVAAMAKTLPVRVADLMNRTDVARLREALFERINREAAESDFRDLVNALKVLVDEDVDEADAQKWTGALVVRLIDQRLDSFTVASASEAVAGLAGNGTKETNGRLCAQTLVKRLSDGKTDSFRASALAKGFVALVSKGVTASDADQWGQTLANRISDEKTDAALAAALSGALAALLGKEANDLNARQAGQMLVRRLSDESSSMGDFVALRMGLAKLEAASNLREMDMFARAALVATRHRNEPPSYGRVDDIVASMFARAPAEELAAALESPAGAWNGERDLLAESLRRSIGLEKLPFWEMLAAAANKRPEAFERVH
jgi:hypothetical protein